MASNFVQAASAQGNTTSVTCTFGVNLTSGNAIVVFVNQQYNNTITSVTDSASNTYVQAGTTHSDGSLLGYISCWVALNVTGGSAATVTAHFSVAPSNNVVMVISEYKNVNQSSAVDQTVGNDGNATTYTSTATGTLAQATETAICMVFVNNTNATSTITSGWTISYNVYSHASANWTLTLTDEITAATTALTASGTIGLATKYYDTFLVTLKSTGAAVTVKGGFVLLLE